MSPKDFSQWVADYYAWCVRAGDALSDFAAKGGGEITDVEGINIDKQKVFKGMTMIAVEPSLFGLAAYMDDREAAK